DQLQILRLQAINRGAGAIHIGAAGKRDGRRADAERLHDVARNGIEQLGGVVAREQQLAERVEPLEFAAALNGRALAALRARRKFAGGNGRDEEGEERDPVLRVGNGKGSDWREKIIIERQGSQQRHEDRLPQSVKGRDRKNSQQKSERNRSRIEVEQAKPNQCDDRNDQRRVHEPHHESGSGFHVPIVTESGQVSRFQSFGGFKDRSSRGHWPLTLYFESLQLCTLKLL